MLIVVSYGCVIDQSPWLRNDVQIEIDNMESALSTGTPYRKVRSSITIKVALGREVGG